MQSELRSEFARALRAEVGVYVIPKADDTKRLAMMSDLEIAMIFGFDVCC